jgi:hypothetical protein
MTGSMVRFPARLYDSREEYGNLAALLREALG